MRFINTEILSQGSKHGIVYPTPSNINYFWGLGSISGFLLVWQVLSGVLLSMHYTPEISLAFNSLESIMRDIPNGWLIRYCHSGGASMFFIAVYIHIGRALYFKSYRKVILWYSGLVIFLIMMATAFLGYVLPWGQMSLWGATVITNLFGSIPVIGSSIVLWLWGGFSVSEPTLKRFFVLHFILPMVLLALSISHILLLHQDGSTNPFGFCGKMDNIRFYPKFIAKDIFGFFLVVGSLSLITVFWFPNLLGDPDNYIRADALVTPTKILPEWYFLVFYAILRAIPDKLGGVIAMFFAIKILFWLPIIGDFKAYSPRMVELFAISFWCFVANVILLLYLGSCVVEQPYIIISQISTVLYFSYFLIVIPVLSIIEKKAMKICYYDCVKLF